MIFNRTICQIKKDCFMQLLIIEELGVCVVLEEMGQRG